MAPILLLLTGLVAAAFATSEPYRQTIPAGGGASGGGGTSRYCGNPCPPDCVESLDESRQCLLCQCSPKLDFGDLAVPGSEPCPRGLQEAPSFFGLKICRGQGCTPGARWKVNDDCSSCVCTNDGEPACTPCRRPIPEAPVTCEGGHPRCPQDCGSAFNEEKNCLDCKCVVGEPGDVSVPFGEPCPPGTDFRESGAFFKACGPIDSLPKGDTKICEGPRPRCPPKCDLVRSSEAEGCVYCQCGPVLAQGDEVIPIYEQCRSPLLPGPTQLTTRVCKAPTKKECLPGTVYNVQCDICLCQADGVPACTKRNCSEPKYGDHQECRSGYRQCPADCGLAGSDSYCTYCQCGPRLEEGEIAISFDRDCPPGFTLKTTLLASKTCTPVPPAAHCQYGPSYIDECSNLCKCTGGGYSCTRKACRPGQTTQQPLTCNGQSTLPRLPGVRVFCHQGIVKVQPLDAPCIPNSWFLDNEYCNTCHCSETGIAACTLKACVTVPPAAHCQYGPSYIDECSNLCKCTGGGYSCTRKACRPGQTTQQPLTCNGQSTLPRLPGVRVFCHQGIVKVQPLDAPCIPNSWFLDNEYCNTCHCSETGIAACTLKACVTVPPAAHCQYGPSYIDECSNLCKCTGGGYSCTRKACRPGQTTQQPLTCNGQSTLPRLPGVRVFCHQGIVKVQPLDAPCVPDSEFLDEEYCNTCYCIDGGIATCTQMACRTRPSGRGY
ncbi:kielin/chordin-like protein [Pollicipes pollicipes]|uniref:kielin/chordin-like protein n=1 Tax=Pollicipes pollicipes TaxID=41117 RepID=UPI0018853CF6|nr:kielin/chordin-like protein [Pollicipes pollicipes]